MVDREKNHRITLPDPDSPDPWLSFPEKNIPAGLQSDVVAAVHKIMRKNKKRAKLVRLMTNLTAAACVLAFVAFSYEQLYSLKKINHLESQIAINKGITYQIGPKQNDLLIIHSMVSWSALKNMGFHKDHWAYTDLLPVWVKSNLFGDDLLKIKINDYLLQYQPPKKIHQ